MLVALLRKGELAKKLIDRLRDNFNAAVEHPTWLDFSRNATTDFKYKEGEQWTKEEIEVIEKRGQAATVENEIKPICDRLTGQYKKQKTRIVFRGRNLGKDEDKGNVLSDLMLHAQQRSGYEFEEGDMFDDGVTSGFGVLDVFMEFDDALKAIIRIKHEDCLDMFPDPNSKRYDWNEDAEFVCRAKWISYDKAKARYPKKAKQLQAYINVNKIENESQEIQANNYIDYRLEKVRLVEQEYKTYKTQIIAITEDNDAVDLTDFNEAQKKQFREKFPDALYYDQVKTEMKAAVFCGDVILEDKKRPYNHNLFRFVPYYVYRKKNGEPYGVVRNLKDINAEINKRGSKALHLLNTNQAIFEEGAIRDKDKLVEEMAKPDGIIEYKRGYKFALEKNVEVASAQVALQTEKKQAMARVSGISDESMARHSEIRSGVGLQRKQMMTDIIIMPVFDNLRRTRLMVGRLSLELMKQYYTEETVFFITDDNNASQKVELTDDVMKSMQDNTYDLVIEEMPDTATLQDEQFRLISDILKGLNLPPQYTMTLLPLIIRLSTIRGKDKVLEQIQALSKPPPEAPKMSLNFVWSELTPFEKAWVLETTGHPEVAKQIMAQQKDPAHVIKDKGETERAEIKSDTDLTEAAIKAKAQVTANAEKGKDGKKGKK